ncbi:hypothetical protein [Nocardia farcinica]|uniref:hypothetical protein n=1 Tax=Nocardia farcinica TaxID=37329 RepID=UPI00245378AD|nr:hypothetical protein [Nocardia farcinica]
MTKLWWRLFGKKYTFVCLSPTCDGIFFTTEVALYRYPEHLPHVHAITGVMTCRQCGMKQDYFEHVSEHRGWRGAA